MKIRDQGWSPRMAVPRAVPWVSPEAVRMAQEGRPRSRWIPRWVSDLVDRWRHPGESVSMRSYRRWRDDTGRGVFLLSSVREVSGPSRLLFSWERSSIPGPSIVGARIMRRLPTKEGLK